MITATIPGTPPTMTAQQKGVSARSGKVRIFTKPEILAEKARMVAYLVRSRPPAPLAGPLRVSVQFLWPDKPYGLRIVKPDLDNCLKLLLDACTAAGFWTDDNQVAELQARKLNSPDATGILVHVTEAGR
jgi:Holliday junction resolvase RusA-like endonuclease